MGFVLIINYVIVYNSITHIGVCPDEMRLLQPFDEFRSKGVIMIKDVHWVTGQNQIVNKADY